MAQKGGLFKPLKPTGYGPDDWTLPFSTIAGLIEEMLFMLFSIYITV